MKLFWVALVSLFMFLVLEDLSRVSVQEDIRKEIETLRRSQTIEVHLNVQMPEVKKEGNRGFAK